MQYIVDKRVTLKAKGKEYRREELVSATDVGADKIKSWLAKGYIRKLGKGEGKKPPPEQNK